MLDRNRAGRDQRPAELDPRWITTRKQRMTIVLEPRSTERIPSYGTLPPPEGVRRPADEGARIETLRLLGYVD